MPDYTDFALMSNADAAEYLNRFLADQQWSLDRFASTVGLDLAFTPDALGPLWAAVAPQLSWRVGYEPPALGQPGPRVDMSELEPPTQLPSWFHHPSGAGYARFSAETLWLIDGAARYLGETVVRSARGRWATGNARTKGYMFQNQPVIEGATAEPVSPLQTCAVLTARSLRQGTVRGPRTLADVYTAWTTEAP